MASFNGENFEISGGKVLEIRSLRGSDATEVIRFLQCAAQETTHTMQYVGREFPPTEEFASRFETTFNDPVALHVGVFSDSSLVASVNLRPAVADHKWVRHIASFGLIILRDYWGHGLGQHLMKLMETHALSVGVTKVEAMVRTKNDRGTRFYNRQGYTIEGRRKSAAFINGECQDEYYISKMLGSDKLWSPPNLKTERLNLRALKISDAQAIFEYAKNSNVSRFTLWEPHQNVEDSRSFVIDYAFQKYQETTPEPFGIILNTNPEKVIGTVGCFWVSKEAKCMELAYAIGEPFWGNGFVHEASKAVVDYVFKEMNIVRLQARCKVENRASARVMEKLGMKHEGTLRASIFHRDRYWDMHYCSVLREEWCK